MGRWSLEKTLRKAIIKRLPSPKGEGILLKTKQVKVKKASTRIERKMSFYSNKRNTSKTKYFVNDKEVSKREYDEHTQKKRKPYLGTDENGIPNIFF